MGAYVSTEASEMTDPLTFNALKIAGKSIIPVCTDQADDVDYRADMAYASLVSGIVLANAGLGIVHGLASPVGGFFDIPHGVVCGTVFAETVKINIKLLKEQKGGARYLNKYARIGAHWSEREKLYYEEKNIEKCCQLLVETIEKWLEKLDISRLSEFGIKESDLDKIAENTGNKNNPVPLNKEQIKKILKNRL
ncbi:MAG: alcohol dehydrogenase, partial [Bacillota bacterium]